MRFPARRKLPSSTFSTLSLFATSPTSAFLPLKEKDDVRATTRRPSTFARVSRISSLMPSQKYSWSFAWLISTNGSTAMDFWSAGCTALDAGGEGEALRDCVVHHQ